MEAKKVAFSDQFFSYRRKVVSGFGLGVVASLVIFSLLFYCNVFKPSVGKSGVDSLFISWPFSFSTTLVSTSPTGKGSAPASDLENLNNTMQSEIYKEGNGSTSITRDQILLKNQTQEYESKNGSFNAQNASSQAKPSEVDFRNGSSMGEAGRYNGSFSLSSNYKWNEEVSKGVQLGYESNCLNCTIRENQKGQNLSENEGISAGKINSELTEIDSKSNQKCDLFDGRWVRDDTKPYYPAGSCPLIDRDFDCHLNQRPDEGYVKWKWQPSGCDLPSLNATDFLERLRGKKVVFVGDSLNRNMWESLVCILRHSISHKKRVYEISGRTEFKKKGFYAFRFEDYNCSVDFVSSPFLVRESSFKGKNGLFETLRLDLMDQTTSMYSDADVLIFNTGHWWTHEKTSRGEDYYQEGEYVHPRLKVLEAYKRALTTWSHWIDENINPNRTIIFFRGYSLTHFRGGLWNSGGQCHKEADPIFNESQVFKYPIKMRALEYVLKEMKTPVIYLNISRQTGYRKDGHPSIYRMEYRTEEEKIAAEQSQDCSHWCLPGVPDTWNELLYASLLKVRLGRLWGN